MREIGYKGTPLAQIISIDECGEEFNFFTRQEDALQIGLFRYGEGRVIQNHVHNVFPRTAEKTCEMLLVLRGRMRADIYTNERELVQSEEVGANELIILLDGGHGFQVLEPDTVILEAKNGPYFGVAQDKVKF